MTFRTSLTLCLLGVFGALMPVSAQTAATDSNRSTPFSHMQLYVGGAATVLQQGLLSDFQQLAPNSALLAGAAGYETQQYYHFGGNSAYGLQLGWNLKKSPFQNFAPVLRVGMLYNRTSTLGRVFRNTTFTRIDSLYNGAGELTHFVEEADQNTIFALYRTEQVMLDASLIYRSTYHKRWSVFMGAGLSAGISYNNSTEISGNNSLSTLIVQADQPRGSASNFRYTSLGTEFYRNQASWAGLFSFPIGIEYRLGKANRDFLNKMHLSLELRPGMAVMHIPEANLTVMRNFTNSLLGIRFQLD
jgi:hypothetical protein